MGSQHELFLKRLAELQGSLSDAAFARHANVPVTTLKQYSKGSLPSIAIAGRIAEAFGVSLDWLSGRGGALKHGGSPLSERYLTEAISIVEEWLDNNDRTMVPAKKAEVVTQLYEFIVDDALQGRSPVDVKRLHGILRLVA